MGLLSPGDEVEPGEVGAEEGAVGGGVAAQSGLALPCQAGGEDHHHHHHQPAHRPQHQNSGLKQTFSSFVINVPASLTVTFYDNLVDFIAIKWSDQ